MIWNLKVWVDGSCWRNGQPDAVAGVGVFFNDRRRFSDYNVSELLAGRASNNRAEIWSAIRAIEQARIMRRRIPWKNLIIYTDSEFLYKSMNAWIDRWIDNDWYRPCGEPVKNKVDFLRLLEVTGDLNVRYEWVQGHSGNYGNEKADRFANLAIKQYHKERDGDYYTDSEDFTSSDGYSFDEYEYD